MYLEPVRTHIRCYFQFSLRPDEVHSSGWKLVYNYKQSSVPEKNYLITSRDNRMRNLHQIHFQCFLIRLILSAIFWICVLKYMGMLLLCQIELLLVPFWDF